MAAGQSTRSSTLRVWSCSGGSVSNTRLGNRHGFSSSKSERPTPRADVIAGEPDHRPGVAQRRVGREEIGEELRRERVDIVNRNGHR